VSLKAKQINATILQSTANHGKIRNPGATKNQRRRTCESDGQTEP